MTVRSFYLESIHHIMIHEIGYTLVMTIVFKEIIQIGLR